MEIQKEPKSRLPIFVREMDTKPQTKSLIVTRIINETSKAKTFFLAAQDGRPLHYIAGQFINFLFATKNGYDSRSYSISTVPEEGLAITVKAQENGSFSRYLHEQIKTGDLLQYTGIHGRFTLPDGLERVTQVFFFAAGSGITPIFSLIKTLLKTQADSHIFLAYSNASPKQTIFYEALQSLQKQYQHRFTLLFIFSSDKNLLRARLSSFWISELVQQHRKYPWENVLCYCCGPVNYMDTVKITMLTEGLPSNHFFIEYFEKVSENYSEAPPDKSAHLITVKNGAEQKSFTVQYPETILERGLQEGVPMPHSCRSGQCGTCTARILSGEVWLRYNEVLTHHDLQNGLTLTCMGFPIDGDVVLSYDA